MQKNKGLAVAKIDLLLKAATSNKGIGTRR